jgi:hypothetical protein
MQVRDLIEELQRFDPRDEVEIDATGMATIAGRPILALATVSGAEIDSLRKTNGVVVILAQE